MYRFKEALVEPVPEDLGEVMLTRERREDLRLLYDNVGETRNADVTIRWYISAVMFTLNAALLPFGLDRALKGEPLGIVVGLMEVSSIVLWFFLEMRMEGVIQYWNSRLIAGEDMLRPIMRVFGGEEYRAQVSGVQIRTHYVLILIIMLFSSAGIVTISVSLITHPRLPVPMYVSTVIHEKTEAKLQQLENEVEKLQRQVNVLSRPIPKSVPKKKMTPSKRGGSR